MGPPLIAFGHRVGADNAKAVLVIVKLTALALCTQP